MWDYPTNRDTAEWAPDELRRLSAMLDKAGVPERFRRYQQPVIVGRDHDIAWLRFEAAMWKRSYEISERANSVLRHAVGRLRALHLWAAGAYEAKSLRP